MTTTILPPYQIRVRFSQQASNSRAMRRELSGYSVEPELVWVVERKIMTQTEYRAFERDFSKVQPWINRFNNRPAHCIVVQAPRYPTLYVKPEGHGYARYVGFAVEE